jgi:hypothetical protein
MGIHTLNMSYKYPLSTHVSLYTCNWEFKAYYLKHGGKYLCYKVDKCTYGYCIPLLVGIKPIIRSTFLDLIV